MQTQVLMRRGHLDQSQRLERLQVLGCAQATFRGKDRDARVCQGESFRQAHVLRRQGAKRFLGQCRF